MLGLTEFLLVLLPVALYAVWRISAARGGPPVRWLVSACLGVAVLVVILVLYVRAERMDPNAAYVPPSLSGGTLVPGHSK